MSNVSNCQIMSAANQRREECMETYLRTNVHPAALPVSFSSQLSADLGVFVEGDVLSDELPFLGNHVDVEGARTIGLVL